MFSWCSVRIVAPIDVFLMQPWREMHSTSSCSSTILTLFKDFSAETLQDRREWHDILKVLKGNKSLQLRILYMVRLSFRIEGEVVSKISNSLLNELYKKC